MSSVREREREKEREKERERERLCCVTEVAGGAEEAMAMSIGEPYLPVPVWWLCVL